MHVCETFALLSGYPVNSLNKNKQKHKIEHVWF